MDFNIKAITDVASKGVDKVKDNWPVVRDIVKDKLPALAFGGVTIGIFAIAGCAIVDTIDAVHKVEERKKEEDKEKLDPIVVLDTVWKSYIRTGIAVGVTLGCAIFHKKDADKKTAAAMMAYSFADESLKSYKAQAEKELGKNKSKKVEEATAQERVNTYPPIDELNIYHTGRGNTLIYESVSKQWYYGNIDDVHVAEKHAIQAIKDGSTLSMNEWLDELGIPDMNPIFGEYHGWSDMATGDFEVVPSSILKDGCIPAFYIGYSHEPEFQYDDSHRWAVK